jgi:hypothetical protein
MPRSSAQLGARACPVVYRKEAIMRSFLSCFFLCALAFAASAQQAQVAPVVGPWDYGENRCGVPVNGYTTEDAAVVGQAA